MAEDGVDLEQAVRRSNREFHQEWSIDVDQDPNDIPLDKFNPAHPGLFEANAVLPYFERLRREEPVHYLSLIHI